VVVIEDLVAKAAAAAIADRVLRAMTTEDRVLLVAKRAAHRPAAVAVRTRPRVPIATIRAVVAVAKIRATSK
ncbi:MAG: hypothetical protein ABI837_12040, partial [Acidobacteriota bacterium]